MRVLHVVSSFQLRGAEHFAYELTGELSHLGVEQAVVGLKRTDDQVGFASRSDIEVFRLGHVGLQGIGELRAAIRRTQPDCVFCHGNLAYRNSWMASRLTRVPLIYLKIGLTDQWLRRMRWLKRLFSSLIYRQAAARVVLSKSLQEELKTLFWLPESSIEVIPHGKSTSRFDCASPVQRASLDTPERHLVVIWVGALSWEKNPGFVLQAARQFAGDPVTFWVVGDGPLRDELQHEAADLGLCNVRFLGVRNDVPELMAAGDVFLLCSLSEGVPGVLIEAGMAGIPSLTWGVGSVEAVVKDGKTGLVTPYGDEQSLYKGLLTLLENDDLRRRMGREARCFCNENFGLKPVAERYLALFSRLTKQDAGPEAA